jgi:SHOCT-like domain
MSVERRKVLEMLAAGKITPEEAEQFLNRLASAAAPESVPEGEAAGATDGKEGEGRPRSPRFLRVVVDSPKRDSVNIRLPLGLIRTGLKLSTMMPKRVSHRLSERGIDLSHLGELDDEALIAELAALQVDIAAEDGEKIRIFCE